MRSRVKQITPFSSSHYKPLDPGSMQTEEEMRCVDYLSFLLSFFLLLLLLLGGGGRKEEGRWRQRRRPGGLPDSLEPGSNSLIESE